MPNESSNGVGTSPSLSRTHSRGFPARTPPTFTANPQMAHATLVDAGEMAGLPPPVLPPVPLPLQDRLWHGHARGVLMPETAAGIACPDTEPDSQLSPPTAPVLQAWRSGGQHALDLGEPNAGGESRFEPSQRERRPGSRRAARRSLTASSGAVRIGPDSHQYSYLTHC